MYFNTFFKRKDKSKENELKEDNRKVKMGQGLLYLYMIVGGQVVLVFALLILIIAMGTIISTPLWAVVASALLFFWGAYLIYRQIKIHLRRVKKVIKENQLGDRNFEISLLGGVLTMKIEHNPHLLLEESDQETADDSSKALIEAKTKGVPVLSK